MIHPSLATIGLLRAHVICGRVKFVTANPAPRPIPAERCRGGYPATETPFGLARGEDSGRLAEQPRSSPSSARIGGSLTVAKKAFSQQVSALSMSAQGTPSSKWIDPIENSDEPTRSLDVVQYAESGILDFGVRDGG